MILDTVIYQHITLWNLLAVIIILAITAVIIKIITLNLKRTLSDKLRKSEIEILLRVVKYIITVFAIIAVLPFLSIDLSGILLAGGFAGLVIGFASQSVVSNLVSGIFLIIERPIKIGDEINIENTEGFVEDIRFLSTIVRTYDGVYVRLPNEKVFTSTITNYVADIARRFELKVGIGYKDDAERAIAIINETIDSHPFALKDPFPDVFVNELGESGINIIIRAWAPTSEWSDVKKELLWKVKVALERGGIELPYPHRVIWLEKK